MPPDDSLRHPATPSTRPVWEVVTEAFVAWRGGDRTAIEALVRAATPTLWHVVRAYRLDEDTTRDVVQTTWTSFVARADAIEDPHAVMAWLMTSARREAWRVSAKAGRSLLVEDEVLDHAAPPAPSVADLVDLQARDHGLWTAVTRLSDRCQRLLRVIAFEDRPDYRHLAEDLGMAVGSIGPTRGRCLDRLRAMLVAEGAEGELA